MAGSTRVATAMRAVVAAALLCACTRVCAAEALLARGLSTRGPVAEIASDMAWGGAAGGALSGLFIGYRLAVQRSGNEDWVPALVTGVGVGLASGLVLGVVDAFSAATPPALRWPVHDGMSLRELRPVDLSGQKTLPLWAGRF